MSEVVLNVIEIILIVMVIIALAGSNFLLSRLKRPLSNYVRISAAIALLVLIWVFGGDALVGPRILLTVLALTSIWREYFSLKKLEVSK